MTVAIGDIVTGSVDRTRLAVGQLEIPVHLTWRRRSRPGEWSGSQNEGQPNEVGYVVAEMPAFEHELQVSG